MAHLVQCRQCKEKFDRDKLIENVDWVQPSPRWYYHKSCYEKMKDDNSGNDWIEKIYDIIKRDLKGEYNYHQISTQIINFIKLGLKPKGMYLTIKYYYLVLKNPWEEKYGIGIIPSKYKEAESYWKKFYFMQEYKNNLGKIEKSPAKKISYNQKEKNDRGHIKELNKEELYKLLQENEE